jgi:endonuclease/exonuclease/phosphatase family metal-dependent hydrolase
VILLVLLAGALSLVRPWETFQMPSGFGLVAAGESCLLHQADWHDLPAPPPAVLNERLPELRVLTYNVRYGIGPRWRPFAPRHAVEANLRGIARHIAAVDGPVDVVALNEVDFGSRRSAWVDQSAFLAAELQVLTGYTYSVVRGETWRRTVPGLEVSFGNAALVRHPVLSAEPCLLGAPCGEEPAAAGYVSASIDGGLARRLSAEPRGVLHLRIDLHGRPVNLLVTHLEAVVLARREGQAAELLSRFVRPGETTLLLGDINALPTAMTAARAFKAADRTHDILTSGALVDARVHMAAQIGADDLSRWATYPAPAPKLPLDAVLATTDLAPLAVEVIGEVDSDHRGLFVRYGQLIEDAADAQARWHQSLRRHQLDRILACDFPEGEDVRRVRWLESGTQFLELVGNERTYSPTELSL